jgi:hypothetical protein
MEKIPTPNGSSNKGIQEEPFPGGTIVRAYPSIGLRVERIEERAIYERIRPD